MNPLHWMMTRVFASRSKSDQREQRRLEFAKERYEEQRLMHDVKEQLRRAEAHLDELIRLQHEVDT